MKSAESTITTIQLTEKSLRLSESENKYLFKVARDANKMQIKQAVEELFDVTVTGVNTLNRRGKIKRGGGRQAGRRPNWKRAVVTLKDGDTIDFT